MKIMYPIMRHYLQRTLLALSDVDYQMARWVNSDRKADTEYVGFHIETENLLNNIMWDENENLIGALFRSKRELDVCFKVVFSVEDLLDKRGENLTDKEYITSPEWGQVVAEARYALRVLNEGDE